MEWLNEYEKLVIRMDTPKVVIDNAACPTATLVQVDSARNRGVLLEAVQVLADLDLSINKAYISSDGRWFMDVFHVTDRRGRKLTDHSVISYIQQSLAAWNGPVGIDPSASAAGMEGLTAAAEPFSDSSVVAAVPACSVSHPDRRLHQLMHAAAAREHDDRRASPSEADTPSVSVESWAERGYSVVTVQCGDRPKLLYDVVCTLTDMDYVVFHGTVDTSASGGARQEFYIRSADGSPISSDAEMRRVSLCLQDAIERRSFEGVRLELCTPDRPGLLSDVTRTFRENGLLVAQAEVSTKGDMASNVFYVTGTTAGQAVHRSAIDAVREKVGVDSLVVEERPPQLHQKETRPADRSDGGLGLFYLGNLFKRNLYSLGLIKSFS